MSQSVSERSQSLWEKKNHQTKKDSISKKQSVKNAQVIFTSLKNQVYDATETEDLGSRSSRVNQYCSFLTWC